ncbi:ShlB/FhaC/HecB family hemolysin secretion/activation protein [Qipengyuania flava]|uniref:ShlB/FhaC/HecB family hemolysin secretion/activation protein n=1 Tax=Qipengyuania flava TaxID=192812 RepID=UPI00273EEFB7|nr:ShlB/FhaC/HecB family hemolysin secretion/activation protein [Qipengyuania flava]
MRYPSSPHLAAAISLAFALPANAQETRAPIDEAAAIDAKERSVSPSRETPSATQIEPRTDDRQSLGRGIYNVGPISLEGLVELSVVDFVDIIERYAARDLDGEQLNTLASEVAARAQAKGYVFATAMIEPQSLRAGVLRVRVDEGRIDRIRIDGDDDAAIRSQLAPLLNGRPVTKARLERHLLLSDDISGVRVRRAYFEREADRGVLVLEARRSRASGAVVFENDGTAPVGPERLRIDADFNGLLTPTDEVDITLATTPFEPGELQYAKLKYEAVISSTGTQAGVVVSHSRTDPGAYLADDDVTGRSTRVGIELRHPFIRRRNFSLWGEAELQLRDIRRERDGALDRHDRIPVVRLGAFMAGAAAGGRYRARVTYSQGLSVLGATERGDPLASRDDASAVFSSLYAWADWERELGSGFSMELAARGQIASAPLLSTEDLGLGGNRFLRGYPYSQRSGDEGIMGSGELRYDWEDALGLLDNMQIYAYADGGYVGNIDNGRGTGELYSAGGGLRTDIVSGLDFDVELAMPLSGPRYDTDDDNPRLNLKLRKTL